MAAAVSSLVRVMNGVDPKESASAERSTAPIITRDLLGGCCIHDSKELDLDPKRGKVHPERCNSSNSPSSNSGNSNEALPNFQELDFHSSSKQMLDDSSLDLKLVTSLSSSPPNYQSVCTLDKVKLALARAEEVKLKKLPSPMSHSSLPPPSNASSLITRDDGNNNPDQEEKISASFAAGCPCCLLYVLISKANPKCPRCSSDVPLHVAAKKPRIDLNMAI